MQGLVKKIVGATLALLTAAAAHGQALAPDRQFVSPTEFSGTTFSCNAFAAAREGYMRTPRPAFNCTAGIDCPQDLQPAAPKSEFFVLYYDWVDKGRAGVDVTLNKNNLYTVSAMTGRLLRDMDTIVRSKGRSIVVVGHTDTSGSVAQNQRISETLATCVKNIVEVSVHLNGYAGVYDFEMMLEARGETDLAQPTADGVREPLNRRGAITIRY